MKDFIIENLFKIVEICTYNNSSQGKIDLLKELYEKMKDEEDQYNNVRSL